MTADKKRILLTGARFYVALDLARQFHAHGHEVYAADSTKRNVCRYSNSIKKNLIVPSPRFSTKLFIEELVRIVKEHDIDMLVPTFEETFFISEHLDKFPKSCQIFTLPYERLDPLHDKWKFTETLKKYGFETPTTFLLNNQEDLQKISFSSPYILKACYSRASLNVYKVLPSTAPPSIQIEPHNPWIAQEWIEGDHFCTYSICQKGELKAHATYPVKFTVSGSSSLTYQSVQHPGIIEWTKRLVKELDYTGQIAFDFIQTKEGKLYAIECNPRATSGAHLFNPEDNLISAFLDANDDIIYPSNDSHKQLAIGMLLFGWKNKSKRDFFQTMTRTKDVIFSRKDLKPFLAIPYIFGMYWGMGRKLKKSLAASFTHDTEWNNERIL